MQCPAAEEGEEEAGDRHHAADGGLCRPCQMNWCCGSTGLAAGETTEGRGLGEEDMGGGKQKAVCTE